MKNNKHPMRFLISGGVLFGALAALQGCAVVAVVDTVGTIAVKTVALAADAAIGVVKISGKAVGAAADAVVPDGK
jgi:hypothetical protein